MRITNNITLIKRNFYQNKIDNPNSNMQDYLQFDDINSYKYAPVYFGGAGGVVSKKINIDLEKSKLIKYFDEILKDNAPEKSQVEKMFDILQSAIAIKEDKTISPQIGLKKVLNLQKKMKQIKNGKDVSGRQKDERIDCLLINKFKTAVLGDNFNLKKVFDEYYSDLKDITSVEKLNEMYPKIKTPKNPAEVIARKIESSLTRDFYEDFTELIESESSDVSDVFTFSDNKIRNIIIEYAKKFNIDPKMLYGKTASLSHDFILDRYQKLFAGESFSTIPMFRKNQKPLISETDIKLLSLDYEKYVLDVITKHYLEGKKINEIKFFDGKTSFSPASLQEPDYKFEKMSEKIKGIINTGNMLENAQRDYKNFDVNQLRARLNFYANSELGNNEEILERIIAFDSSKFIKEEMSLFVKFLKELDLLADGKKSLNDTLETIYKNELRPKATERLTEMERQKAAEQYKLEMKKAAELNEIKGRFDSALNFLYTNDLSLAANKCAKYRPRDLSETSVNKANELINLIQQYIKQYDENSIDKSKIENGITRWDTFNLYKTNYQDNPVFKKALAFAKDDNDKINIDKAGKYILNSQLVENYPDSIEFSENPAVLSKIMENVSYNTEDAVKYLCKFDEYLDMDPKDKICISKFAELFNIKDSVEKTLLKHIVKNDYLFSDTTILTNIYDNEYVSATISAKAKQEIYDKYKFPLCIEYMTSFEEALTKLAAKRGASGIKKIIKGNRNKTQEFLQELKIIGHDDRLFSTKKDNVFDVFSGRGIH